MSDLAHSCPLGITLNDDQRRAYHETMDAIKARRPHLITGFAGSGKTTLVQVIAAALSGQRVALTAPTHKAVAVLARKLKAFGIEGITTSTIHSLLSLRGRPDGDRMLFERTEWADPITADVVVIDECSMISHDLMAHIMTHLRGRAILFVGDPAQLPPVGEVESESFQAPSRSHLHTVVRQAAENPVLAAALALRETHGGPVTWDWCQPKRTGKLGVFQPGNTTQEWMQRAFCSDAFRDDPDNHRYLAYTNARVHTVNTRIRAWIYGDNIPTPFMPGERALFRVPLMRGDDFLANTNEEVTVLSIEPKETSRQIRWSQDRFYSIERIPSWRLSILNDNGSIFEADLVRDVRMFDALLNRIKNEARERRSLWKDFHEIKSSLARLQSIYAMTIHTSQGSTFRNVFLDIGDIRPHTHRNALEAQQLLYVGATRPSHTLTLVGV